MHKVIIGTVLGLTTALCFATTSTAPAATSQATGMSGTTSTPTNKLSTAVKWYNDSAEKNALYLQIFRLAKPVLDANKQKLVTDGAGCGVVFGIDQTLLDNTPYQVALERSHTSFNLDSWGRYVNDANSSAEPGAAEITNYVHSIGCKVNLVTNRLASLQKPTEANLKKQGVYFDQVLYAADPKAYDKNPRFDSIVNGTAPSKLDKQIVIAYFGSDIQDFPYSKQSAYKTKNPNKASVYSKFGDTNYGDTYFVLPNVMYGSWDE